MVCEGGREKSTEKLLWDEGEAGGEIMTGSGGEFEGEKDVSW